MNPPSEYQRYLVPSPLQAFELVTEAWHSGRRVVPLLGAGPSIEAGIPGTTQIGEYLAKVQCLADLSPVQNSSQEVDASVAWLNAHGWPDFNEVGPELLALYRRGQQTDESGGRAISDSKILEDMVRTQLRSEFAEVFEWPAGRESNDDISRESLVHALLTQWRTLMRRLTGGDPVLLDPFFDALARGRRPGKAYLFAAALCRLLGWRLLLTTNFDSLLEDAVTEAGLRPNVFPIREDGTLPDPEIVQRGLTIIKLHGDRFSPRFSDVLDTVADKTELDRFRNSIGPKSLLLVLGYRGADRRVMSLIHSYLHSVKDDTPAVLWICSGKPPPSLMKIGASLDPYHGRLKIANFHDVGLFLQELYTRIRPIFPASAKKYSAISDSPIVTKGLVAEGDRPESKPVETRKAVNVIVSDGVGRGTSTQLSELARQHQRTHRVVWCDLEEIPNVSALVTHILRQLQLHDPHLTPLLLSHEADTVQKLDGDTQSKLHGSHDPRLSRLLQGLRRGKYFVAIDSMGEFGRSQVGHDLSEPSTAIDSRYAQLCDFLSAIAGRSTEFGESRVAFVHVPVAIPDDYNEAGMTGRAPVGVVFEDDDSTLTKVSTKTRINEPSDLPTLPLEECRVEPEQDTPSTMDLPDPEATVISPENIASAPVEVDADRTVPSTITPLPSSTPPDIGGHKVVGQLGAGLQGMVFEVTHKIFGKQLAAKVFGNTHGSVAASPEIDALLAEAQRAVELDHPNIVRVFDARIDENGQAFVLYELIGNGTLAAHMQNLTIYQKMRIVAQVASALHHSHTKAGLIHRDIKPKNIMLDYRLNAKVVDFGLAVSIQQRHPSIGGSLAYMSPEQVSGEKLGPTSDVYSLGVVMFQLLTGKLPIKSDVKTFRAWKDAIVQTAVPYLTAADAHIPKSLAYICWKCLQKLPQERYRSAKEMADAISAWLVSVQWQTSGVEATVQQRILHAYHRLKDGLLKHSRAEDQSVSIHYVPTSIAYRRPQTEKALETILEAVDQNWLWGRIVGEGNTVIAAARVAWESLSFRHQAILTVAAAFRRPRSIIGLRRIGGLLLREGQKEPLEYVLRTLTKLHSSELDSGVTDEDGQVDQILEELEEANFLIWQEGGFYWMHCAVRDAIFRECTQLEPQGMANLHSMIAYFYYEIIFRPTQDVRAFNEFVAHQLLAIREAPPEIRWDRLRDLRNCLERERPGLLARTHPETLLDWVRTIRDVELPQLEKSKDEELPGTTAGVPRSHPIIAQLRASLCDLEGDVHRYTTNYEACIVVRFNQLSDRVRELKKIWTDSDTLKVIQPLTGHSEKAYETLCTELKPSLEAICASLKVQPLQAATRSFRRYVRHLMDIAVCLQGLHCHAQARTLFVVIKSEMEKFCSPTVRAEPGATGQPSENTREWAAQQCCACSLRLMESWSGEVYTWDPLGSHEEELGNVVTEYSQAIQILGQYSEPLRADYVRNVCYLKSLVARAYYMRHDFDTAYLLLDSAGASVHQETNTSEQMALAVCEMRRAECMMLHADVVARESSQTTPNRKEVARNLLNLAGSALEHSHQILSAEPGHVWRWSILFLSRTQLIHEEVAWTYLDIAANGDANTKRQDLIRHGLSTISGGLDNIEKDRKRWKNFRILWWQFYLSIYFDDEQNAKETWMALNDSANLRWYYDQEMEQSAQFLPRIEAAYSAVIRERKQNPRPDESLRDVVIDFQRQVLVEESAAGS